jgi:excisionase family DNA binding protein
MAVNMTEERALTLKDVATRLSVSERTVLRLAEERDLVGYKVGHAWRFEPSAVRDFIERQQQEKKSEQKVRALADVLLEPWRLDVMVKVSTERIIEKVGEKLGPLDEQHLQLISEQVQTEIREHLVQQLQQMKETGEMPNPEEYD